MTRLILASTSPYRAEQLKKLGYAFEAKRPLFDEESFKGQIQDPVKLAETLSFKKAESLMAPGLIVIGGDQLVSFQNQILGKPHTVDKARSQLAEMAGKVHELITSVSVISDDKSYTWTVKTLVKMRALSFMEIGRYIEEDQPLDCAGSYKIELNGIRLMENIMTEDFTSIQGLPLLSLHKVLKECGL